MGCSTMESNDMDSIKLPEPRPLAFGVALAMADEKGNSPSPQFIIGMGAQIGMVIL